MALWRWVSGTVASTLALVLWNWSGTGALRQVFWRWVSGTIALALVLVLWCWSSGASALAQAL